MSSSVFPSAHDSKYDRQLRLWGSHGQAALESAHIAVLGSSGTAAEALKNLVLPNIGKFTIIDNAIVTEADLGQNFFVTSDWLGKSRSEAVKVLLSELNAEVQGHHIHQNPLDIIHNQLESFAQYDLVLATQGPCHAYLPLADYLYQRNIPFIYLRSYGLLGHVRLQIREHFIVESHPSNDRYDLFIHPQQLVNWPELKAYCDQFPLDKPIRMQNNNQTDNAMNSAAAPDGNANAPNDQTASSSSSLLVSPLGMDSEEHSHVPYIAILHHVMDKYLQQHNQRIPSTYEEKKHFKQLIIDSAWNYGEELNFQEAFEFAHRAYDLPKLDHYTQRVMDDPAAAESQFTPETHKFWLLVAACNRFYHSEGNGLCWPVAKELPDMHSKTEYYVQLKRLFNEKADKDIRAVWEHAKTILLTLNRSVSEISLDDTAYFVRNLRNIRVVKTRSLREEIGADEEAFLSSQVNEMLEESAELDCADSDESSADVQDGEGDDDMVDKPPPPFKPLNPHNFYWYAGLRCVDEFQKLHGKFPGLDDASWEREAEELKGIIKQFVDKRGIYVSERDNERDILSKIAVELSRYGGCEPHVTAAFMGGMGAQVALKLVLKQYVPINNSLIYNGIHCSATTMQL